jgi:hypothetical protein
VKASTLNVGLGPPDPVGVPEPHAVNATMAGSATSTDLWSRPLTGLCFVYADIAGRLPGCQLTLAVNTTDKNEFEEMDFLIG